MTIARTARRHRLPSEASKRYERGVDPALAAAAAEAAVRLLVEHGGATAGPVTDVDARTPAVPLSFPVSAPAPGGRPAVRPRRRRCSGCATSAARCRGDGDVVEVVPPTWRPDLTGTAELVEEVVRLEGYDTVPVALPTAPAGRGLTPQQRLRRTASRALAGCRAGRGRDAAVRRRRRPRGAAPGTSGRAPRLVNPLSAEQALMRPTLLPGLLAGRRPQRLARPRRRRPVRDRTGLPRPRRVGGGARRRRAAHPGAAGRARRRPARAAPARRASPSPAAAWDRPVEALVALGRALGLALQPRAAQHGPFHPGRCAELLLDGERVGLAGELHPRVVGALGLPARTCAGEVHLDRLVEAAAARGPVRAPLVSHYPPSAVDVALVVDGRRPRGRRRRGPARPARETLLEDLRLFDVYTGPQVGEGRRSLAFGLRFRAPDRTLTDVEVLAARDEAVAEAGRRTGAALRA